MGRIIRLLGCLLLISPIFVISPVPATASGDVDLLPTEIDATALFASANNSVIVIVDNNGADNVTSFDVKLEAYNVSTNTTATVETKTGNSILGKNEPSYWPAFINFNWAPATSGNYTLIATVDSSGNVTETDETNNVLTNDVTVIELAPVTVMVRVEGQTSTIWSGNVTFSTSAITDKEGTTHTINYPTALGALDEASKAGSFSYVVRSSLYVEQVAGETCSGWDGWMYRVDWATSNFGAEDYALSDNNTEVLWYYGTYGAKPLKLTTGNTSLTPTDNFTATVKYYDDATSSFAPLSDATLHADSRIYTTDANGQVNVSLPPGVYNVYADKGDYTQYTRSNNETVIVYVTLTLRPGWNFISIPKKLAGDNCTASEVFAGVNTGGHSIFQYTSSVWSAMSTNTTVSPLEGIWIYSTSTKELRPQFDPDPRQVPPTKQLSAGWNAIGFSDFTATSTNSALTSVESKWATLIGYDSENQTYESSIINNDTTGGSHDESGLMHLWRGYWLYMTSAGELAGIGS
ncbi:MAG: DUF4430 domain-containing protein [Dehalococcoidia bacterium]|nr:MAG: DUF4430 domain-containing protein [Dehalococcoidia bacterium]